MELIEICHKPAFLPGAVVDILLTAVQESRIGQNLDLNFDLVTDPLQAFFQNEIRRVGNHQLPWTGLDGFANAGELFDQRTGRGIVVDVERFETSLVQLGLIPFHGGSV